MLSDLTFAEDGDPDAGAPPGGEGEEEREVVHPPLLNFCKRRTLASILSGVMRCKMVPFRFEPLEAVQQVGLGWWVVVGVVVVFAADTPFCR